MNMVEQYNRLQTTIKTRAIYINNMLSELVTEDNISYLLPTPCNVDIGALDITWGMDCINLVHYFSWENYTDDWSIPIGYIDSDDEDIKTDFLASAQKKLEYGHSRKEGQIRELAEHLGYKLIKENRQ